MVRHRTDLRHHLTCKLFAVQMREHEKEDWFQLYQEAVLELEHVKMTGRIRDARAGISARIEALGHLPGLHNDENLALLDASSVLRTLEREEQRLAEEERKRLAVIVLEKIHHLCPKIKQLNSGEN